MTSAGLVKNAYDQIDQARAGLKAVSGQTTYENLKSSSRSDLAI